MSKGNLSPTELRRLQKRAEKRAREANRAHAAEQAAAKRAKVEGQPRERKILASLAPEQIAAREKQIRRSEHQKLFAALDPHRQFLLNQRSKAKQKQLANENGNR